MTPKFTEKVPFKFTVGSCNSQAVQKYSAANFFLKLIYAYAAEGDRYEINLD
jgi:hypothetical protein